MCEHHDIIKIPMNKHKYFTPIRRDRKIGPSQISLELVRQWIRDNVEWRIDDEICIRYGDFGTMCRYYPDLESTGRLEDDGFVVAVMPGFSNRIGGVVRWNPSTGEYIGPLKYCLFNLLVYEFGGAGVSAQLDRLKLRMFTPMFTSLSSTHIVLRSFPDRPVILPYYLLGDVTDINKNMRPSLRLTDSNLLWTAGSTRFYLVGHNVIYIITDSEDGLTAYKCDNDNCIADIRLQTYQNGIVLHIIPTRSFGHRDVDYRYSTVMIINK